MILLIIIVRKYKRAQDRHIQSSTGNLTLDFEGLPIEARHHYPGINIDLLLYR